MGIYTSSKGEEKDTSTMPYSYLQNALNKARQEENQANIDALEEEMRIRPEYDQEDSESTDDSTDIDVTDDDDIALDDDLDDTEDDIFADDDTDDQYSDND